MGKRNGIRQVRLGVELALVVLILSGPLPGAHRPERREPLADLGSAALGAKEAPMPFRVGEKLGYTVSWAAFSTAASVELSIPERRNLYGWQTWHFRAVVHTLSPVRSLFQVDDQFDSYTDAATLESRQFELHLDEIGKASDAILHPGQPGQEPHAPGPLVLVLPGTRDALGTLESLRSVDWQRTPEFRATVFDGTDVYQMRAQCEATNEAVTVSAGSFSTSRISIRVFEQGKEVSVIHFVVWLVNDGAHTPAVMQATLPLGNLRAELVSASN